MSHKKGTDVKLELGVRAQDRERYMTLKTKGAIKW